MRGGRRGPARLLVLGLVAASLSSLSAPGAGAAAGASAFTGEVTATRVHLEGGKDVEVDRRTVRVQVDATTGLRDRQGITVSWTGARPSSGIVADQNSAGAAAAVEYPVVLLQCRGVDSDTVPESERLRPETCYTQTPFERFTSASSSTLPPWRLDRQAAPQDREQITGAPAERPAACGGPGLAERWVPFVSRKGTVYPGGSQGCGGMPPEASAVGALDLPANTTYAATSPSGGGSALFNVRTADNNASLGCSAEVACSLVVIPVMGISCDVDAAGLPADQRPADPDEAAYVAAECTAAGRYGVGQPFRIGEPSNGAVTGNLWWSASNWRHRITVPLGFAPSPAVCDIVGGKGVDLYGSEVVAPATQQWAPVFCLDAARTPYKHVQTGEPQARNLLNSGGVSAALVSEPPETPWSKPVVTAPVAVSGFAVTFAADGADRQPMESMKLTPRLIAKLLTQSYPATFGIGYEALAGNPLNMTLDPEFIALNPGARRNSPTPSAATLLNLSSGSDVVRALTSYLNADPDARAWLDGVPDPWGMKVNPSYREIALPVDTWELRDPFLAKLPRGSNICLDAAPVPYLPLVAAPLSRLAQISLAMQFSLANSQLTCVLPSLIPGDTAGAKLSALGRQLPGERFMIGLMSLGDAERYQVRQASLQTRAAPGALGKFTNAEGRTFVTASPDSLRAGVAALVPEPERGSWRVPYDLLREEKNAGAYPGLMVVYAALPTSGLPAVQAKAYAEFVRYAAGPGQVPGTGVGQLPGGFLPMTSQNGAGALADFALRAAAAVGEQTGQVPALLPAASVPAPAGPAAGLALPPPGTGSSGNPVAPAPPSVGGPSAGVDRSGPAADPAADPGLDAVVAAGAAESPLVATRTGVTALLAAGAVRLVMPLVLALGLCAMLVGPTRLWRARRRVGP